MMWHVLYLKPKTEKKMAEWCQVLKLDYYLPLREETKIYQRRKVTVSKPLFPGYFFAEYDQSQKNKILSTNNVLKAIEPQDEARFLHELDQIRLAISVDPSIGSCSAVESGHRIRITGGPFQGVEGIVSALNKNGLVRLNVDIIGQAVAVEIEKEYLELIDE